MTVLDAVQEFHDKRLAGCRGGQAFENILGVTTNAGCFYGITGHMKQSTGWPFVIFNGDGPEFPFEILCDRQAQNEVLKARTVSWNEFVGTERSLEWVRFLKGDNSPWWKLKQYFSPLRDEFNNNAGFVFQPQSGPVLPTKLLYNFCMAMRFCWDQPSEFSAWLELRKTINPSMALFIAMNFKPKTKNVEGPWEIMWPWNFLEDGGIECAYRFINGLPGTLDTDVQHNPNVQPLWATGKPNKGWVMEMSEKPKDLDFIIKNVCAASAQQQERLKCVA